MSKAEINPKKRLVILTTHFGTNFSGGSTATCEIFSRIEHHFSEIVVVGNEFGEHPFSSLTFLKFRSWPHAISLLIKLKSANTFFYGDFYNSFLYVLVGIPFCFTYHDNWPELGRTSLLNRFRALYFFSLYRLIFSKAVKVFSVSSFRTEQIKKYTDHVHLIKNGFTPPAITQENTLPRKDVLMVGTIDQRKYEKTVALLSQFRTHPPVNIDIYGRIADSRIARKLQDYSFVRLKGFQKTIPYWHYRFLLHTSLMENLPIVLCEAIACNTPILAFDIGGISELVDEQTGILIPPYDLEKMQQGFMTLLRKEFLSSKHTHPLSEHSWEAASDQYLVHLLS